MRQSAPSQTRTMGPKPLVGGVVGVQPASHTPATPNRTSRGAMILVHPQPTTRAGAAADLLRPVAAHRDHQLIVGIDEGGDGRLALRRALVGTERASPAAASPRPSPARVPDRLLAVELPSEAAICT